MREARALLDLQRRLTTYLLLQGSIGGADSVARYVLLGNTLDDGVFAWVNFAVDPTQENKAGPLSHCSQG